MHPLAGPDATRPCAGDRPGRALRALAALLLAALAGLGWPAGQASADDWPMFARDLAGSRMAAGETANTVSTVRRLRPRWVVDTGPDGDVTATPAVVGGTVYFGAANGRFFALDARTGAARWVFANEHPIDSSAAVAGGRVFFGDAAGYLNALDAATGRRLWRFQPDATCGAHLWGSPVPIGDSVLVGSASDQEVEIGPDDECPALDYRGSVLRVDQATGAVVWQTFLVPPGASGATVWSTPAVDEGDNAVYVTTGNNYGPPSTATSDAIVRLRLDTGAIAWSFQGLVGDVYPTPGSPDFDFSGSQPILWTATVGGVPRALVGAGQKSGAYWALDRATGSVVWRTRTGDGGRLGGYLGAQAAAGGLIFGNVNNENPFKNYLRGGSLVALRAADGVRVWSRLLDFATLVGPPVGPVAATPSLVFTGTAHGSYVAFDYAGRLRWQYQTDASMFGGAAIVDGTVYVGSGSGVDGFGRRGRRFYAFSIDGK